MLHSFLYLGYEKICEGTITHNTPMIEKKVYSIGRLKTPWMLLPLGGREKTAEHCGVSCLSFIVLFPCVIGILKLQGINRSPASTNITLWITFFLEMTLTHVRTCNVIFKTWCSRKDAQLTFQFYLIGRLVKKDGKKKRMDAFQDLFEKMQVQWKKTVLLCCHSGEIRWPETSLTDLHLVCFCT